MKLFNQREKSHIKTARRCQESLSKHHVFPDAGLEKSSFLPLEKRDSASGREGSRWAEQDKKIMIDCISVTFVARL